MRGTGGSRGAWSWVPQGEPGEPWSPYPGFPQPGAPCWRETGTGREGSGWAGGWLRTEGGLGADTVMGQVWPHSRPLAPSRAHTRAGRGEAACKQRGRVEGERAGPREGWGVRPPPGGPLCPPLPGKAGAARVSSCDAPRAASVTRAVFVLLGPKWPRNTPGQPPGASPASSRGLGRGQPQ